MSPSEKIQAVVDHVERVRKNCLKVGMKMIYSGDVEMGRQLIHNGHIHDASKFTGIEFEHLFRGDELLPEAVKHHSSTNPHHPEFWGGIRKMPEVYLAEMVCDCAARASEFGSDVRLWFSGVASKKYNYNSEDEVYFLIEKYLDMLLEKPFS